MKFHFVLFIISDLVGFFFLQILSLRIARFLTRLRSNILSRWSRRSGISRARFMEPWRVIRVR